MQGTNGRSPRTASVPGGEVTCFMHPSQPSIINIIFYDAEERLRPLSFLDIKNITKLPYEGSEGIFSPKKVQRRKVLQQCARPLINSAIIFLYFVTFVVFFRFKILYSLLPFLFSI